MNDSHTVISQYITASKGMAISEANGFWVLATLIKKTGSSYRKEGAMMFVSPTGKTIGALSGGCLEKDIVHQAHRVSLMQRAKVIEYDSLGDDDSDAMKNTGCSGKIQILLAPITEPAHLQILQSLSLLEAGKNCIIRQTVPEDKPSITQNDTESILSLADSELPTPPTRHGIERINASTYSFNKILPRPKLLVIGAGHDAVPICEMAVSLGWAVYLWDERIHDSHLKDYGKNIVVDNRKRDLNNDYSMIENVSGVILKSHNMAIDAFWLAQIEPYRQHIRYIGLLGPNYRKDKVIEQALLKDSSWAEKSIFSPAGLDIGGDTPESIALSILSQAHIHLSSSRE